MLTLLKSLKKHAEALKKTTATQAFLLSCQKSLKGLKVVE